MPSPEELAALRANVLGAFDDYSRLRFLGERGSQLPAIRNLGPGFTIEDKGAAFLAAMLNEFFSVSPEKNVYVTALDKVNGYVDRENYAGGRAWGLVRDHLLEIGAQRGWNTSNTLSSDWTPNQQQQSSNMVRGETRKQSGGCYIATAVYGSYDCPEVWVLRRFRDQMLMSTVLGRLFVRVYYATSPFAVRFGGSALRTLARRPLEVMIRALRTRGFPDTPF